ncbi:MAG: IPT/TIG domain-containing protein [Candidatus Riflebacteria bacterium]|nr:IPT/TIG domain-containing protein [Candidatus Riflebacteria bacterium]
MNIFKKHGWKAYCILFLFLAFMKGCGGGGGSGETVSAPVIDKVSGGVISGTIYASGISVSLKNSDQTNASESVPAGQAIASAEVWLQELPEIKVQSDSSGKFVITGVPVDKTFRVIARFITSESGITMIMQSKPVTLSTSQPTAEIGEITLQPGTKVVSGILKDADGKPLPNATMSLWGITFTSDSEGKFTTPPLPESVESDEVTVKSGTLEDIKFSLYFLSGAAPSFVELSVPTEGGNNFPPIIFISSAPESVPANTEVELHAEIYDPDEMDKTFFKPSWNVTDGIIIKTGDPASIIWKTPTENGLATVSVSVTDSRGGKGSIHAGFPIGGSLLPVIRISSVNPTSGSAGIPVKITGTGFGTKTASSLVSFNGALAEVLSWSENVIETKVPADAKTGLLLISNADTEKTAGIFTIPDVSVTSLYPTSGAPGTVVKISGTGFGISSESSFISFNGKIAQITSWSDNEFLATVPPQTTSGLVLVNIRGKEFSPANFVISDKSFSVSKDFGPPMTTFEVAGSDFGTNQENSSVMLNGTPVTITSWSDSMIGCKVPDGATGGVVILKIRGREYIAGTFIVTRVFSVSTTKGTSGTEFIISGEGFGPTVDTKKISFSNGNQLQIKNWSSGSISGNVPSNASTGQITGNIHGIDFKVSDFFFNAISKAYPGGGKPGDIIEITGTGFGTSQGTGSVSIGNLTAAATLWTDTLIKVAIPTNAVSDNLSVYSNGVYSNSLPVIIVRTNSVTPTRGFIGTKVIVSGQGFGNTLSKAYFAGNVVKDYRVWSDASIEVIVPEGISGTTDLTVSRSGPGDGSTLTSNPVSFIVAEYNSVDVTKGWPGMEVTVTGKNFGTAPDGNSITFSGKSAPVIKWTETEIIVRVPENATSGPLLFNMNGFSVKLAESDFEVARKIVYEADANLWSGPRNKTDPALSCAALAPNGDILISDYDNNWIWRFDSTGKYLGKMGTEGDGNAQFYRPWGISFDSTGNIFIADSGNDRIQKYSAGGDFLGWYGRDTKGVSGWHAADSAAVPSYGSMEGEFKSPSAAVTDSQGNIYIADTGNHRIQIIKSTGEFVKYIGKPGALEGYGDAEFKYPGSVALDSLGRIFVADTGNHRIQIFNSLGVFESWIGQDDTNLTGVHLPNSGRRGKRGNSTGMFDNPNWVHLDATGTIYIADTSNNRIQLLNSQGQFVSELGEVGGGLGQYKDPASVLYSDGIIYVTDMNNSRVQLVTPQNAFLKAIVPDTSGLNTLPTRLKVDSERNLVYVVDTGDPDTNPESSINVFDTSGNFIRKLGSFGSGAGQFKFPRGVTVDRNGNVYVADSKNARIQKFNSEGVFLKKWGAFGTGDGQFSLLQQVAADPTGEYIYSVDSNSSQVQKFTSDGAFVFKFGTTGNGDSQFNHPSDITVDSSGNVYVVDTDNHRVQKFSSSGSLIGWFGKDDLEYAGWHAPSSGRVSTLGNDESAFDQPYGIAVDYENNVFVADPINGRIQVFSADQSSSLKAGFIQSISLDSDIFGISLDAGGRIYLTRNDKLIQKFIPSVE